MTPTEAAVLVERLPAATVKLKLFELLEWQAAHQKRCVNLTWYIRRIYYQERPRLRTSPLAKEVRARLEALTNGIGRASTTRNRKGMSHGTLV